MIKTCGLIGVVTAHKDRNHELATRENFEILAAGLKYLRRRGPNSFGAAFVNPMNRHIIRRSYTRQPVEEVMHELKGIAFDVRASISLGQTKWLTDYTDGENSLGKAALDANTQPVHLFFDEDQGILNEAVGIHNGNIPSDEKTRMEGMITCPSISKATVDTRYLTELFMQKIRETGDEWEAAKWVIENIRGAYTFGYSGGGSLIAFKDRRGYRPLCIGRKADSVVLCSESGFFEELGVDYEREINPGEMVRISDRGGLENRLLVEAEHSHCPFEDIYFKDWFSRSNDEDVAVTEVREMMGAALYHEYKDEVQDVDIVSFAPDSGRSYAFGFAHTAGKRAGEALRKPRIKKKERHFLIRGEHKYVPNTPLIKGKNIAMLDDSIMRGDTIVEMYKTLKDAGVKKVYFFSAWPPNFFHCDKGIDTPTDDELIAYQIIKDRTVEYSPETGVSYETRAVNRRMTEITRQGIKDKYGGKYKPEDIFVFYGTIGMLREHLPTKDNCEFCITGIDPELRQ